MLTETRITRNPLEVLKQNPKADQVPLEDSFLVAGPETVKTDPPWQPNLLKQMKAWFCHWRRFFDRGSGHKGSVPTGKLGDIVRCLEASESASLHDLMTLTGWKRSTVHGALSRLRARGYKIRRDTRDGTPVYRLEKE